MSVVAPKNTYVVVFDNSLRCQLVYDSMLKPRPSGIDYLCGVEVMGRNHYLLHEGWLPSISQVSSSPRTFMLSISKHGQVEILP